jgi:tetratricopeptide (TPR) repeat protein
MFYKIFSKVYRATGVLVSLFAVPFGAVAQPLDDVSLEFQDQGVVATIRMTGPVQYLSHFPSSHGKTLEIFYARVQGATSTELWRDNEVRKSPPSNLIPSFTVTTRDQQTKPKLVIEFAREAEYSVAPGKDNRSLLITIRPNRRQVSTGPLPFLPTIKPESAPEAGLTPVQAATAENNTRARALMVQGRDALAAKKNEVAVEAFNKLLLIPPNDFTQDAQEWVGVARERAGQIDKARIEYDLYLRLYPEGEGAARVAQRLNGLAGEGGIAKSVTAAGAEKKQIARLMTFGSVSSRYYYGRSKVDSTQIFNNAPETLTSSYTDQSMLITSLDATERYVSEEYDGRLVFRDVAIKDFLANQSSPNRVSDAYGEINNRTKDYMARLGRQAATGGGVLGRFDGLSGSYGIAPDMRLNGVAGVLVDYSQGAIKPQFAGVSMDKGPLSLYVINQRVESVTDRRAVGTEFRYFEGNKTMFALLDYDAYFKALNAAQVMGSVVAFGGGSMNFMIDHRKSPSLSIRNALLGASTSSVYELLQQPTMTPDELRKLALARTAITNMGQVGISVPFREKWQVGGEVRLTNTTGLPASGTTALEGILAATPSRGTEKSVMMQLIGSGLYKQGDIWSGSVTLSSSSAVSGNSIYLYNHIPLNSGWTMDTSLQLSRYKDQFGAITSRISPMLRGAYRLTGQLYFDADGGVDIIDYKGAQSTNKTTRYFTSIGLRWDF